MVRARASDIVVGGCEFESCHCHLTGHIPDPLMSGPHAALDDGRTGLLIMYLMIIIFSSIVVCFCTTSTNKINYIILILQWPRSFL